VDITKRLLTNVVASRAHFAHKSLGRGRHHDVSTMQQEARLPLCRRRSLCSQAESKG
jgi:hypothetical protein